MHIKTKQLAFLGVLAGVSVILMFLGMVIESNTLFLTAAASFLIGVAVIGAGIVPGLIFYFVCLITSLILLPNKLYCLTYGAFGLYILIREFVRAHTDKKVLIWLLRYLIFNMIYIPLLILAPRLFISRPLSTGIVVVSMIGGQLVLLVMDIAYEKFMKLDLTKRLIMQLKG